MSASALSASSVSAPSLSLVYLKAYEACLVNFRESGDISEGKEPEEMRDWRTASAGPITSNL